MGLPSTPDASYSVQQAFREVERQLIAIQRLIDVLRGEIATARTSEIDALKREVTSLRHAVRRMDITPP